MSQSWRDVAIYGTAALTGLLSGLPTGEAANCLKILFDGREPNLEAMAKRAEGAIDPILADDLGAATESFRSAIVERLKQHGSFPATAVHHDFDAHAIAAAVIPDHDPLFTLELAGQAPRARQIVAAVYKAVLEDPNQFNAILPRVLAILLQRTTALPQATAEAFLDLQTRLLLSPGTRASWERNPLPSALLRPDYAVVPFDPAREPAAAELLAWCEDPAGPPRAVRLLHGEGGFGKSRLLIEVTGRLRARGWRAGFLTRPDADPPPGTYERLCAGDERVCIAVDYAETRREEVARLLRRVHGGTAPRLRVVLLARAPGEWWPALARSHADLQELLGSRGDARALPPIAQDDHAARQAAFRSAADAFAKRLGRPPPAGPEPDLSAPAFGRFLYVHMAALAAVEGTPVEGADKLIGWVLDREEGRHWATGLDDARLPRDRYLDLVRQAVALATLAGSLSREADLKDMAASAPLAQGVPPLELRQIAKLLARLYPDPNGLGALRPDLLGEELAAKELHGNPALLDAAFGLELPEERLANGLTVLARLANREPESEDLLSTALTGRLPHLTPIAARVAVETEGPMGHLLAVALRAEPPADPRPLEALLPWETVALREFRVAVTEQIRDVMLASPERESVQGQAGLARITGNLGIYLSALGQLEEALRAAEEAVSAYRALAVSHPVIFNPDLAGSLSNLGVHLGMLNRREEALRAEEEAVEIRRALAAADPGAFRSDLATSLTNLGVRLKELSRYEEALRVAEEGVAAYRALAAADPDAFRPDLALSLSNLGGYLSLLNRREEALWAEEEAVVLRRTLAATNPDAFRPDLARSIANLSLRLGSLNRREAALWAAAEATEILRSLAAANPAAFGPDLAMSLSILGEQLVDSGRLADALTVGREAIATVAPFLARLPEAFAPYMDIYVRDYCHYCEVAGLEPDAALLALARHAGAGE